MANTPISINTLKEYLAKAIEIEDQTGQLSIEQCRIAWGYNSTYATRYTMKKMVEIGFLVTYPRGKYTTYRVANGR